MLGLVLLPVVAVQAAEVKPGEIRAQGDATVYVMPDKAGLQFTVLAQDKELARARELSAAGTENVLKAIRDLKIDKLTMKTTSVQVMPLYEPLRQGDYGDQTARKILAYRVSNTVAVTIKSDDPDALKDAVSKVIDAALLNGANGLGGPWFSKEDDEAARREALEKATREAVLNAQAMAKGLDVRIARYTYVSMLNPQMPGPVNFGVRAMAAAAGAGGGGTPSPVEIEALAIGATVYVNAEY
jgi:uncharacterized protein YggE